MQESISKATASKIVNVLKNAIQHDITFMDTNGYIIACTNPKRVGEVHGGSREMLDKELKMLVVNSNDAYEGTCCGINMALSFHDKIVGIVGITGDPHVVACYGNVIRHMTELLLLEDEHNHKAEQRRYDISAFLHQWIQEDSPVDDAFLLMGLRLGINIKAARRVVVADFRQNTPSGEYSRMPLDYTSTQKLSRVLHTLFGNDYQNIWYVDGSQIILLLHNKKSDDMLCKALEQLRSAAQEETCIQLRFGCDNLVSAGTEVRKGYRRALLALNGIGREQTVSFYNDVDLGQLIRYIPANVQWEFLRKVFAGQTPEQIEEWCGLIDAMVESNGSISAVAQNLYIHKNTVQYRIAKLQRISGYDCRESRDVPVLFLARLIWDERKNSDTNGS